VCGLRACGICRLLAVLHQQHDQSGAVRAVQRHVPTHVLANCDVPLASASTTPQSDAASSVESSNNVMDRSASAPAFSRLHQP